MSFLLGKSFLFFVRRSRSRTRSEDRVPSPTYSTEDGSTSSHFQLRVGRLFMVDGQYPANQSGWLTKIVSHGHEMPWSFLQAVLCMVMYHPIIQLTDVRLRGSQDLWRRLQHLGTWKGLGMDVGRIKPMFPRSCEHWEEPKGYIYICVYIYIEKKE